MAATPSLSRSAPSLSRLLLRYRLRRRLRAPLRLHPSLLQEYIEKLRWVDKFVRDEVEPLDQLNFSPCEPHPGSLRQGAALL